MRDIWLELTSWDFGDQLSAIDYNLSTLRIFRNEMGFNNASYSCDGIMSLHPGFIEGMIGISGNPLADKISVNMHLIYEDETRLDANAVFFEGYTDMQKMFFRTLSSALEIPEDQIAELYIAYHSRAKVPKISLLYGDEIWDGAQIAVFSSEVNNFWDNYYQSVSQWKTVPVCVAVEIMQSEFGGTGD